MPEMDENGQVAEQWEAPPPPAAEPQEDPEMSEMGTVGNIFFEPERTFKDLRKKPRFIIAGIIIALLGLTVGYLLSLLMRLILPSYIPLWAPVAGFVASVGIGLFFGLWPAWKAARLDPIESLRYE